MPDLVTTAKVFTMSLNREVSKNRILLYYILVIVLPCIALGIMAFRGIRNDQALVERENQRKIQEIGDSASDELINQINSLKYNFGAKEKPGINQLIYQNPQGSFTQYVHENPLLESIVHFTTKGKKIIVPNTFVLYVPDESEPLRQKALSESTQIAIDRGWEIEFIEKSYRKAINYFNGILNQGVNNHEKALIISIIARNLRKLDRPKDAIIQYELMVKDIPGEYLPGNIPAGITARREIVKLYLDNNQVEEAINGIQDLIETLHKAENRIKQAYFLNTLEEIDKNLEKLDAIPERLVQRLENLDKSIKQTAYLYEFSKGQVEIENIIKQEGFSGSNYFFQLGGSDYFFSSYPDGDNYWLLVYDIDECFSRIIKPIIEKEVKAMRFSWSLLGLDEDQKLQSEADDVSSIEYNFPDHLPNWQIQFQPQRSASFTSYLLSGKGIYLYILILISAILIFGLFFTLRAVNQELQLSRMKSYFISTVSHEFKSPITSLRQMAEMLDGDRIKNEDRKKTYYATMLHESERLSHLVENILDFARMEQGRKKYNFKNAQLEETISEIIKTFQIQNEGNGVEIKFNFSDQIPAISYDKEAIEQVMHNLLDNAFKYSGDIKQISVSIEKVGNLVVVKVKDRGIGISKADQSKIFNRFFRAGDELTGSVKGSGIGLTIVRQIIEDHGGKVSVKSKPGEGSTFIISLPIKSQK